MQMLAADPGIPDVVVLEYDKDRSCSSEQRGIYFCSVPVGDATLRDTESPLVACFKLDHLTFRFGRFVADWHSRLNELVSTSLSDHARSSRQATNLRLRHGKPAVRSNRACAIQSYTCPISIAI